MRCILDATASGFMLEEIKPDSGSVEGHTADAMAHLNDAGTPGD
jgi:hypothetical protein